MQRRHHQGEEETKARAKNGVPLPPDGFSMPCKRQALIFSLNPYSLPFFIPLHFACRRRPNPIHLFVPFSIAMFSGLGFNPFFYLLFFGLFGGNFIRVSFFLCYRILRVTSNICCLFCLALKWGLAILSVIALTTISVSKHVS